MSRSNKWIVMIVLSLAGTVIFILPYLREIYYLPLQRALGINNTQIGMLMSVFGVSSMLSYIPGGWLADRIAPRLLISLSLILTGALGFYFATFPSYPVALTIHGLWGITVTGMLWGAMIKATREWAPSDEQGRAFGFLEAGRGVSEAIIYSFFLFVFAWLGSDTPALSSVIMQFSVLHVVIGVVAWFVLDPENPVRDQDNNTSFSDFIILFKMPAVWLIAVIVMTCYCAYWGAYYFTPYASDVFMLSVVTAGAIGVGKVWLKPFAALIAGFVADRVGINKAVSVCFILLISSFLGFALMPSGATFIVLMVINVGVASLVIFAMRGIYFALLEECNIPHALTGCAVGIISVIGFTPDIFMPLIGGLLLDNYPGPMGYRLFFGVIAGFCTIGLMASLMIRNSK
ncbi:MAG: MFS transporter [Emcibacter sp.]|nr:MFS transporter [Emcibacter sp.]